MQTVLERAGGAIPRLFAFLALAAALGGLAAVPAEAGPLDTLRATIGQASWYGGEFRHKRTANGDRFDPEQLTAAHRTLPLGSKLRITNLHNGRSVLVTITDRGPFRRHRDIDVSYGAARLLGMVTRGVARVRIEPAV